MFWIEALKTHTHIQTNTQTHTYIDTSMYNGITDENVRCQMYFQSKGNFKIVFDLFSKDKGEMTGLHVWDKYVFYQ